MKASLNWIQELLPELSLSPDEIAAQLTAAGLEVEARTQIGQLPGVITAEVRSVAHHPNADRLRLVEVFDGDTTHKVVCGAPNVAVGQRVVFAPAGVTLPNGLTLEARDIRGVPSNGMICSEEELGLADYSEGIWVLDEAVVPGQPAAWAMSLADQVLELGVTPNRGDALSHLGLARELAALNKLPAPEVRSQLIEADSFARDHASVRVSDPRCPRYSARVITGVKVGPSPMWLQNYLRAVDLRPISNVVDVTNFILMGLGQPMHAFDLKKLRGAQLDVRAAQEGESLALLNGSEVQLQASDLVIADGEGAVALAGVMGGANSEVDAQTTDILLESAIFEPASVRRTARRLALHSDASHRFERGVDPQMQLVALDQCAELIAQFTGGAVQRGVLGPTVPAPKPRVVPIRAPRASALIGRPVSEAEVDEALTGLGLVREESRPAGVEDRYADALFFRVPSWRLDLEREVDLIEEVARMHGYGDLQPQMPPTGKDLRGQAARVTIDDRARDALVGQGFFECVSLAFHAEDAAVPFGLDPKRAVVLENPLGAESQVMRMSTLPALLKAARLNQDNLPRDVDLRLFEVGRCFAWADPPGELPVEQLRLGVLMRGERSPAGWSTPSRPVDAFDLKAVLEELFFALGVTEGHCEPIDQDWLHPRSGSRMMVGEAELGYFGELHPELAERMGLEGPAIYLAELFLGALPERPRTYPQFKPLPKQPPVQRDLSFFLPTTQQSTAVVATAQAAGGELLEAVRVFDVYEGDGVPEGQRSLALAFTLRCADRSLTDQEADRVMASIVAALQEHHDVHIRGG